MSSEQIRSNFVESRIKKTKWKKRQYIYDLMDIEELALGRDFGRVHFYMVSDRKRKYPTEWKKIWLELNPKRYKEDLVKEKREAERERKEEERLKREEKEELKQEKQDWIKIGGLK